MTIYRILMAIVAVAFGAAAVLALPGFSPEVAASVTVTQKTDRIDYRPIGSECSQKGWPHYETTCLRDRNRSTGEAPTVRVIKMDKADKVAGR